MEGLALYGRKMEVVGSDTTKLMVLRTINARLISSTAGKDLILPFGIRSMTGMQTMGTSTSPRGLSNYFARQRGNWNILNFGPEEKVRHEPFLDAWRSGSQDCWSNSSATSRRPLILRGRFWQDGRDKVKEMERCQKPTQNLDGPSKRIQ